MKKKLLAISIIASGLAYAQSSSDEIYDQIFNRNKTKYCKSVKQCLILIAKGDTICWNHSKKTKREIKKQLRKNKNWFSHYQFERPEGSPFKLEKND